MLVESSSIPKYRDLSQPGDDVVAIVPERLYAVFDGATDTTGNRVDGISPGRFAASQAALAMVRHVSGPQRGTLSATQLLAAMTRRLPAAWRRPALRRSVPAAQPPLWKTWATPCVF